MKVVSCGMRHFLAAFVDCDLRRDDEEWLSLFVVTTGHGGSPE
jgi:hypothetical protein